MVKNDFFLSFKESFLIFLKGLFMGFCDIIPGISGGTIALITGIYERFMAALKNLNILWIIPFLFYFKNKKNKAIFKKEFFRMDPFFLITLAFGIFFAILIGSKIIPYFLDNYTAYIYCFFFGLIFTSSIYLIFKNKFNFKSLFFLMFGILIGFLITGINELQTNNNLYILFIAGFFAVFAMLLPGVSGSFLLLIFGQYNYMLNALNNFLDYLIDIFIFILGMAMGLIFGSKFIALLLKNFYNYTLFFLIGLMVGSLRLPFIKISTNFIGIFQIPLFIIFGIIGSIFIFMLFYFEKKYKNN
ncbi:MAG: DUF368 domain-containing protein [Candidatus Woesearchaeota archaeon]